MIDLPHLARLEEGRCAATLREVGRETIAVAGGVASRDAPGTWVNRAEGIGLSGPVADGEVRRLVAWYDQANLDAQVKICPFVHESLLAALGAAGFVQQALLAARLNAAISRGPRLATIGSASGHDTERNAQRFGVAVANSKTVLVRPRSG